MKTDAELDAIAQAIRDSCQLIDPDYPRTRRKLLRSIEIAALREAREIAWGAHAQMDEAVGTKQEIISELDKLIRQLELR